MHFINKFGGNKLIVDEEIPKFTQGQNPVDHIITARKNGRKLATTMNALGHICSKIHWMTYLVSSKISKKQGETHLIGSLFNKILLIIFHLLPPRIVSKNLFRIFKNYLNH